jgi:hypothetical protein
MSEENKPKKDRECIRCEYIFDCEGKPQEVKRCIKFKERKDDFEQG